MGFLEELFANFAESVKQENEEFREIEDTTEDGEGFIARLREKLPVEYEPASRENVRFSHPAAFLEKLAHMFEGVSIAPDDERFIAVYNTLVKTSNLDDTNTWYQEQKDMVLDMYNDDAIDIEEAERMIEEAEEKCLSEEEFDNALEAYIRAFQQELEVEFDEDMEFESVFSLTTNMIIPYARMKEVIKNNFNFLPSH